MTRPFLSVRRDRAACAAVALMSITCTAALAQDAAPSAPPTPTPAPAAQPAPTPRTDLPAAADIIADSIEAIGGKKAVQQVTSVSVESSLSIPNMPDEPTIRIKSAKPKFLFVQSLQGQSVTMGFDGTIGWMSHPMGIQPLDEMQTRQLTDQANLFNYWLLFDPQEHFKSVETVDRSSFGGEDCYKLRLVAKQDDAEGEQFGFFSVEKKNFRGLELNQQSPMGPVTVMVSFDEWKQVEDLQLFTKVTVTQMNQSMVFSFNSVELNKVEPSAFEPPAEVKQMLEAQPGASTPPSAPADPAPVGDPAPADTPPGHR